MKYLITIVLIMTLIPLKQVSAQTPAETEILNLSLEKFRWKTEGKIDLVEDLFDDDLVFVHITGHITTKKDWIAQMRSRSFFYNKIELKEHSAKVYGNTAVLVGKAKFTVNGGSIYNLVYTEVYTTKNDKWKLVNLHTTSGY
jgi:ketosteroid isomerase-like protein